MSDDRDPIIESCLEELLSGQGPPDLKQRILDAWEIHKNKAVRSPHFRQVVPYRNGRPQTSRQHADRLPRINAQPRRTRYRPQRVSWIAWVTALAILTGIGFFIFPKSGNRIELANNTVVRDDGSNARHTSEGAVVSPADSGDFEADSLEDVQALSSIPTGEGFAAEESTITPFEVQSADHGLEFDSESRSNSSNELKCSNDVEIVQFINAQLGQRWSEEGVEPSLPVTESQWCRRAYSHLIGRDPTIDELDRFTDDKHREKKRQLVDALCTSADFSKHWGAALTNLLVGRTTDDKEVEGRQRLEAYLSESILNNTPYDQLVFELIGCEGSNSPDAKDYNGAANFLLANMDRDRTLATSRTCQVFLGKQLQCARCHEHPLSGWSQQQYWQLNAFFRQTEAEPVDGTLRLVSRDFTGQSNTPEEAEVYFEDPSGVLSAAYPVFLDGTQLPHSGLVSQVNRRRELAYLIRRSPDLSRSLVNRLWGHFLGRGFTSPVDDMGPHNPPSHPELLDGLAIQFQSHQYDMKSLVRWIVLSEAFGLSGKASSGNGQDSPATSIALFNSYEPRTEDRHPAHESLKLIADAHHLLQTGDSVAQLGQIAAARQTGSARPAAADRISRAVKLVDRAANIADARADGLVQRIADSKMPEQEKIEHVFLSTVARKPTKREMDTAKEVLRIHGGDLVAALRDIWSALLSSNELILAL